MATTQYYGLYIVSVNDTLDKLATGNEAKIDAALHNHDTAITALQNRVPNPGTASGKFLRDDGTWQSTPSPGQATSSALGTIKIGYTTSGKNYPVQLNGSGQAYVNVPWENTTYGDATTSAHGLMTAADKSKLNGIAAGAQVNPGVATTSANGLMSKDDKSKLNGIAAGAQVNPGVATTSANGLMSKDDKTKLNGIAAGAQVNPGAATQSTAGLMSAADKKKLDGIATGAQVNPGVATTSANGLMSASDKSKLNGIAAGAQVNPSNFTSNAAGLVPSPAGGTNKVLRGSGGWANLQDIVNAESTCGFSNYNGGYYKVQFRYGYITGKESNQDYSAVYNTPFPTNTLVVLLCNSKKFQAADRLTVMTWDKNGFTYNVFSNSGTNMDFCYLALGY